MSRKAYSLGEIAKLLDLELRGDPDCEITGLGTLRAATKGQLSFLASVSYVDQLPQCQASAIIVPASHAGLSENNLLISGQPYLSYAKATALFAPAPDDGGQCHASAIVDDSAELHASSSVGANVVIEAGVVIGADCVIGAGCFVGRGTRIGSGSRLHANVTIYHGVRLGDRVTVHSGSVIGADGFGFAQDGARSIKIHQLGGVDVGDDVEIGACTTIDRGAIEDTVVANGVKIDNHVQVAHNCRIGENTVICGASALAGSAEIGKNCFLGGGSGVVGHLRIADGVKISARTLIDRPITEAGIYSSGTGFMPTPDWKRSTVRFKQLDNMARRLKALEKQALQNKPQQSVKKNREAQ